MTSQSHNVDYIKHNFIYPVLTKIHGVPDYEGLRIIKDEHKSNAGTVQSDLGGGSNGHLGLLLTDPEYGEVSATPYVRPVHPGTTWLTGSTNWETVILREDHKENTKEFREANAVEEALIKQLADALPPVYLKQYLHPKSNKITASLVTILADLFTNYGSITAEQLQDK